jgi:hypothetical protein
MRKVMIGILVVVVFIVTMRRAMHSPEKPIQPSITGSEPGQATASILGALRHALVMHSELVFVGATILIIAALLGLYIFRREDEE